jgi:hypothetical protein
VGTHTIPFHKFAVFENGKLTDDRIVAFITTTEYQGKAYAFWRGITIGTNKGAKKIVLTSDSYDTYDNNISNVNVGKDIFLSPSLQYSLLSGKRI